MDVHYGERHHVLPASNNIPGGPVRITQQVRSQTSDINTVVIGPSQGQIIPLDQWKNGKRHYNEYVDSPPLPKSSINKHPKPVPLTHNNNVRDPGPILSQPVSGFKDTKQPNRTDDDPPCQESTCSNCGKCKCSECTEYKDLPKKWLCNNKCEFSAQKVVDVCSCLCCVKGVFYHWDCFRVQDSEVPVSDDPCACCGVQHCCKRWTFMGLTSLVLPCLYLYPFLSAGVKLCTCMYNCCRIRRKGCTCRRDRLPGSRRLLIDSEGSSS